MPEQEHRCESAGSVLGIIHLLPGLFVKLQPYNSQKAALAIILNQATINEWFYRAAVSSLRVSLPLLRIFRVVNRLPLPQIVPGL